MRDLCITAARPATMLYVVSMLAIVACVLGLFNVLSSQAGWPDRYLGVSLLFPKYTISPVRSSSHNLRGKPSTPLDSEGLITSSFSKKGVLLVVY